MTTEWEKEGIDGVDDDNPTHTYKSKKIKLNWEA